MTVQSAPGTIPAAKVIKRYIDAYRVARVVVSIWTLAQVIGIVAGLAVIAVGFVAAHSMTDSDAALAPALGSIGLGLLVAAIFYIIAVIIRAQGQILRASLDSAVHSSPFLSVDEKARAMNL